jgi:hypothetical protein
MFIDENTSREDLLIAIYGTNGPGNLIDVCIARGIDPETDEVIEDCQATVTFALRRGAAS